MAEESKGEAKADARPAPEEDAPPEDVPGEEPSAGAAVANGGGANGSGAALGTDDDPAAIFSALAVQQEEKEAMEAEAAAKRAEAEAAKAAKLAEAAAKAAEDASAAMTTTVTISTSPELERKLSRAMLNGNFDVAVKCCLEAGRIADAALDIEADTGCMVTVRRRGEHRDDRRTSAEVVPFPKGQWENPRNSTNSWISCCNTSN